MLVDEEVEGDWGFRHITKPLLNNQEVSEDVFEVLGKSLPQLYNSLRTLLGKVSVKK
jgi:hypothetical protein